MIKITEKQKQEIIEQARAAEKYEACGILAGKSGRVEEIYKLVNTSDSPETCYFVDPKEQLTVMKEIRNKGLEMLGIYHSHPNSEAYPSGRDVELAFYSEVVYVIVSLRDKEAPKFRAFKIVEGKIFEEEANS